MEKTSKRREATVAPSRESTLEFCIEKGCNEFAQSSDPTIEDTRLFMCEKHAAAATARGHTGRREVIKADFVFTLKDPDQLRAAAQVREKPKPTIQGGTGAANSQTNVVHSVPEPGDDVGAGSGGGAAGDRDADRVRPLRAPDADVPGLGAGGPERAGPAAGQDPPDLADDRGDAAGGGEAPPAEAGPEVLTEEEGGGDPRETTTGAESPAEPVPPTERKPVMPRGRAARPVKCVETGEVFGSYTIAAKSINRHPAGLNNAINNGTPCGGKTWKYVHEEDVAIARKRAAKLVKAAPAASEPATPVSQKPTIAPPLQVRRASDALVAADAEALPGKVMAALTGAMFSSGIRGLQVDDFSVAVTAGGHRTQVSIKEFKISVTEVGA